VAAVVIGSLKILSHLEKGKLLVIIYYSVRTGFQDAIMDNYQGFLRFFSSTFIGKQDNFVYYLSDTFILNQ